MKRFPGHPPHGLPPDSTIMANGIPAVKDLKGAPARTGELYFPGIGIGSVRLGMAG